MIKLAINFMVLCLAALPFGASGQSIYPENGWWWDASTSGRGYLLERQGEVIFMTSFHYSESGEPEWLNIVGSYTAESPESNDIGILDADAYRSEDGQCPACNYAEPLTELSEQGPVQLVFHSNQSATMSWAGEVLGLSRFFWGFGNSLEQLHGDWLLVTLNSDGEPLAQLATIDGIDLAATIADSNGLLIGTMQLQQGELSLSLDGVDGSLPVLVPETDRFYAGLRGSGGTSVLGLRIDDLPLTIPAEIAMLVNIKDAIFTLTGGDCADYQNQYTADVQDVSGGRELTEHVLITAYDEYCTLSSNSIPNHDFNDETAFFRNDVSEITSEFVITRFPQQAAGATEISQRSYDAVMLNGVVLDLLSAGCYRPDDAGADANGNVAIGCTAGSNWLLDPLGYENNFGTDLNNAHTQPDGRYHYHGNPNALFLDDAALGRSPVIGFAADGFPIYGSYFYDSAALTIRKAVSGYTLKPGMRDSENGPGGQHNGWYIQDYEFTDAADLDECNGMTVDGNYGYYVTETYPWILKCLSGTANASFDKT